MLTLVGPAKQLDRMKAVWSRLSSLSSLLPSSPRPLPPSLPPSSRSCLPCSFASFAHGRRTNEEAGLLSPPSERGSELPPSSFALSLPLFPSPTSTDTAFAPPAPDPALPRGPFLPRRTTSLVRFEDFFVSALLSKAPRLSEFTRRRYRPLKNVFFSCSRPTL